MTLWVSYSNKTAKHLQQTDHRQTTRRNYRPSARCFKIAAQRLPGSVVCTDCTQTFWSLFHQREILWRLSRESLWSALNFCLLQHVGKRNFATLFRAAQNLWEKLNAQILRFLGQSHNICHTTDTIQKHLKTWIQMSVENCRRRSATIKKWTGPLDSQQTLKVHGVQSLFGQPPRLKDH